MFSKSGVLAQGCSWEKADALNGILRDFDALEAELFGEDESSFVSNNAAKNLYVLSKVAFFRLKEISYSVTTLFNQGHLVSSLILVRSMFETSVFVMDLEAALRPYSQKHSLEEYDNGIVEEQIYQRMFATRRKDHLEDDLLKSYAAVNIKTMIERNFDSDDLRDVDCFYSQLCEFTHPNVAGLLLAYSKLDMGTSVLDFDKILASEKGLFDLVRLGFYELRNAAVSLEICVTVANILSLRSSCKTSF